MVRFSLPGNKLVMPGDDDNASNSSGSQLEGVAGPTTPDAGGEGVAAADDKRRYWPSEAEVAAVLERLSEEDRAMCDAAMANRCGCSWKGHPAAPSRRWGHAPVRPPHRVHSFAWLPCCC